MNDSSYFFDGAKDYQGEQQDRDWMDDEPELTDEQIDAILSEAPESDTITDAEIEEMSRDYLMRYAA